MAVYIEDSWVNVDWGSVVTKNLTKNIDAFYFMTDFSTEIRLQFADNTKVGLQGYSSATSSYVTVTDPMTQRIIFCNAYMGGKTLIGSIWNGSYWAEYFRVTFTAPPEVTWPTNITASQNNDGTTTIKWKACTGTGGTGGEKLTYTIHKGSEGAQLWSGSSTTATLNISSCFGYGSSVEIYVRSHYGSADEWNRITKTFYKPSIAVPTSPQVSKSIGLSTVLSWNAAKLSYTSGTITYTIYKNGVSIGTTTATSYEIEESVAKTWGFDPVTLTISAKATGLTNTVSGSSLSTASSAGVQYTYAEVSNCIPPSRLFIDSNLSYTPVQLIWEGASDGVENNIISYHIQYQDSASDVSWTNVWIDLETDWEESPLLVYPPNEIGTYRKFRILAKGTAGSKYYSDWLETDDAILRKAMAPFTGFVDDELLPLSTKIKATHMTEMQNRINNLLAFNGQDIYPFSTIIAGQTKLSGWTQHVTEIREAVDRLKPSHENWIDIVDNRPRADIMMQLRDIMNGYCKLSINVSTPTGTPEGCIVTVRNMTDKSAITQFEYKKPTIIRILPDLTYRVECSQIDSYDTTPMTSIMRSSENTYVSVELCYRNAIRYGYRRAKSNSNPSARIEYLHDAVGMTPMYVDLATGLPNYGSWKSFIDEVCRPVMLKSDGTVDYELNHNNQTLKIDGTPSDIGNAEYDGNAMVEFRNYIWVHRNETTDYEEVVFSNVQYDNTYHAYANINESGNVNNEFYWGMYEGSTINGIMKSIAGQTPTSTQAASAEISQAQANGNGWYLIYKSGWDYIIDLLTLISKTDNSQAAFGSGRTLSSNTTPLNTGSLVDKPAFCGYSDGTSEVKALYIEGLWGNLWERVAGLILNKTSGILVKMTPPYNTTGSGYTSAFAISGTTGNFISGSSCTDACGYLPKTLSGSADTYMCDKAWYSTSGVHYGLIGGRWTLDTGCGSRSMNFSELPTATSNYTGTRISYINPT